MKKIIAFYSSFPKSGKSTAADHLVFRHGYRLLKFADPLKSMVAALLPGIIDDSELLWEFIEGNKKEEVLPVLNVTPRKLFETLGHVWGREILYKDFWITLLDNRLKTCQTDIVVDDLRYPNEYEYLKGQGALLVKIVPKHTAPSKLLSARHLDDFSFDYTLANPWDTSSMDSADLKSFLDAVSSLV